MVGGEHRGEEEGLRNCGDGQERPLPRLRARGTRAATGGLREKRQQPPRRTRFCWNTLEGRIAEKCKLGIWETCLWLTVISKGPGGRDPGMWVGAGECKR